VTVVGFAPSRPIQLREDRGIHMSAVRASPNAHSSEQNDLKCIATH
jgi:hypothetical protein